MTNDEQARRQAEQARQQAERGRQVAEDKRRRVRLFYAKMASVIVLPLTFITLIPALVGLWLVERETDRRISENSRTLTFICSTTTVLDELVQQAATSIRVNLDTGLYLRLEEQGLLPRGSMERARQSLREYERAHVQLTADNGCHAQSDG